LKVFSLKCDHFCDMIDRFISALNGTKSSVRIILYHNQEAKSAIIMSEVPRGRERRASMSSARCELYQRSES
jgi:hypothetical protein